MLLLATTGQNVVPCPHVAQGNTDNVIFAGLQCVHLKIKLRITKEEREMDLRGDLLQNLLLLQRWRAG